MGDTMPKRMKGSKLTGCWGGRRDPRAPETDYAKQIIRASKSRQGHRRSKVTLPRLKCLESPDGR